MRGEGGVAGSQPMSTAVHRSPNKLWRSNSIFNLWGRDIPVWFQSTVCSVDANKVLEVPSILYVDWLIDDKIPRGNAID
jgi:hypothetical protein